MDEHSPSCTGNLPDKQRYLAIEGVEPRAWGPYFLGVYDLEDIIESGAIWISAVPEIFGIPLSRSDIMDWHEQILRSPAHMRIVQPPALRRIAGRWTKSSSVTKNLPKKTAKSIFSNSDHLPADP